MPLPRQRIYHDLVGTTHYIFRCMVFSHDHGYIAESIDLNLALFRDSPEEAAKELEKTMAGYVDVVCNGDITGLIPRRSPFSHRLRFSLLLLKSVIFPARDGWQWDISSLQLAASNHS